MEIGREAVVDPVVRSDLTPCITCPRTGEPDDFGEYGASRTTFWAHFESARRLPKRCSFLTVAYYADAGTRSIHGRAQDILSL
jgi:hypothetical protein